MIRVIDPETIQLSVSVAAALIAFASKDDTRPSVGVGVDNGALCATDGHRAVAFTADARVPSIMQGLSWARRHLETLVKVAKAQKADLIMLERKDSRGVCFAPVSQVLPDYGMEAKGYEIGLDPAYLADLGKVAKACGAKGVKLTEAKGDLDPIGFRTASHTGDLTARVVIMPMRI
jgi:hypothetical protein